MTNNTPELKPCPFCGSSDVTPDAHPYVRSIWCNKCETSSANFGSLEEAVEAWNTRALPIGESEMAQIIEEHLECINKSTWNKPYAKTIARAILNRLKGE